MSLAETLAMEQFERFLFCTSRGAMYAGSAQVTFVKL